MKKTTIVAWRESCWWRSGNLSPLGVVVEGAVMKAA